MQGSRATLTIALTAGVRNSNAATPLSSAAREESRKLVGLIACHHTSPRHVPYSMRAAAEYIAQVFTLQRQVALEEEDRIREERNSRLQAALCDKIVQTGGSVASMLATVAASPGYLELLRSSGGAILHRSTLFLIGQAPERKVILELAEWVRKQESLKDDTMLYYQSLYEAGFPKAHEIRSVAAALFVIVANMHVAPQALEDLATPDEAAQGSAFSPDCVLMFWFRPEAKHELRWAGNRNDPQGVLVGASMYPRMSFDTFVELVQYKASRSWDCKDITAAQGLQLLIVDALRYAEENSLTTNILVSLNEDRLKSFTSLQSLASELAGMVGKANLPVILLDTDGYVVEWSNKVASVTGISAREAKGRLLSEFLPASMRPTLNTAVSAACSGLDDVHLDLVLNTYANGVEQSLPATISMHVSRRMAKETGGMVLMMVGVDVTKQTKLFAQIAAPTNNFSELLEMAAAPAFGTDMTGRVNKWNKLMARLCGIDESEVQGLLLIGEVFGRNGRIKVAEQGMQILLELAIAGALVGEISAKPIAITCFLADGRSCNLQMNFGIRRNLAGEQVGAFCFALVRWRHTRKQCCAPHTRPQLCCPGARCGGPRAPQRARLTGSARAATDPPCPQEVSLRMALEKATAVRLAAEAAAQAKTRQLALLCHEIRNPLVRFGLSYYPLLVCSGTALSFFSSPCSAP